MATSAIAACPFSHTLSLFQADPEILTEQEWEALEAHLFQEPFCPLCREEMIRNQDYLDAREQVVRERREGRRRI